MLSNVSPNVEEHYGTADEKKVLKMNVNSIDTHDGDVAVNRTRSSAYKILVMNNPYHSFGIKEHAKVMCKY